MTRMVKISSRMAEGIWEWVSEWSISQSRMMLQEVVDKEKVSATYDY